MSWSAADARAYYYSPAGIAARERRKAKAQALKGTPEGEAARLLQNARVAEWTKRKRAADPTWREAKNARTRAYCQSPAGKRRRYARDQERKAQSQTLKESA